MKLYSLINENNILLDEPAESLDQAVNMLVRTFGDSLDPHKPDEITQGLMQREQQHPTGLDNGVFVPHMRMERLERFLLGLMVPDKPLPHPQAGQPPVAMFFLILAPQNKNTMMLQTMAAIARLLKSRKTHQALLGIKAPARVIRMIEESGIDVKKTLMAGDIMAPVKHVVTTDMILARAVDVLVDAPDEGVPVINDKGELIGELTSREVLTLGMPKYLDLIANPAMLDSFEPFENFFKHENNMTVRELCRRDLVTVDPATPVVHVTHAMITAHKRRIYVVDEGILKGVIYRKNIVSQVLHL